MKSEIIAKSLKTLGIIFVGKLIEFSPLFLTTIVHFVSNQIFNFLKSSGSSEQELATHGLALANIFQSFPLILVIFVPITVLLASLAVTRISRSRKAVKHYWLLATLADLILLIISSASCDPGFLIGICNLGLFLGIIVVVALALLRGLGLFISFRFLKRERD